MYVCKCYEIVAHIHIICIICIYICTHIDNWYVYRIYLICYMIGTYICICMYTCNTRRVYSIYAKSIESGRYALRVINVN